VLRGGGDLATGVAWHLTRQGWPVVVLELPEPLAVRRTVSLSTAVADGEIIVQGMKGVRVESITQALAVAGQGDVAVLVAPALPPLGHAQPDVVVDARMAKRNIDTAIDDAECSGEMLAVEAINTADDIRLVLRDHELAIGMFAGQPEAHVVTSLQQQKRAVV